MYAFFHHIYDIELVDICFSSCCCCFFFFSLRNCVFFSISSSCVSFSHLSLFLDIGFDLLLVLSVCRRHRSYFPLLFLIIITTRFSIFLFTFLVWRPSIVCCFSVLHKLRVWLAQFSSSFIEFQVKQNAFCNLQLYIFLMLELADWLLFVRFFVTHINIYIYIQCNSAAFGFFRLRRILSLSRFFRSIHFYLP